MRGTVELINASIVRLTAKPPLARALATDTRYANPAVITNGGGFSIIITKYADNQIVIEVAEGTFNIGGFAEFATGAVSYDQFVKYANFVGDRIAHICRGPERKTSDAIYSGYEFVIGRSVADRDAFSRIKTSVPLAALSRLELLEIFIRARNIIKNQRPTTPLSSPVMTITHTPLLARTPLVTHTPLMTHPLPAAPTPEAEPEKTNI